MDWASQRLEQDILDTPQIYEVREANEYIKGKARRPDIQK